MNAVAGAMGMTPEQVQALQGAIGSGRVSPDQIDSMSVRLGVAGINSAQVQSIGKALGLSDAQMAQLQQNLQRIQTGTGMISPQGVLPGSAAPAALLQNPQGAAPWPRTQNWGGASYYSDVENTFRTMDLANGQVPEFTGPEELTQFGYDFFSSPASTANLSASQNIPVNADYVVGPGDQLQLTVWGTRNETDPLAIGRDGSVQVPAVGPVQVAGLRFDEAKKTIEGKVEQITGVHASVTMGQIRTITVFVVGAVASPGPYTLNALARISNALVAAGGPTKVGSLRRIERKRDNQLIGVVDLYDVLLRGDTAADSRLEDHDAVLVPTIGPVLAIAGDVKRPAIFEMSTPKQSLASAIRLAGGISAFASTQRIQVERVENHERRIIVDARLDGISLENFAVVDGDLIKIFPVLPNQKNKVTPLGNVFRPGDYQWHAGLRLSDLINLGEGVQPKTYFRYALVKRLEGRQLYPHYLPVDLGHALDAPRSGPDPVSRCSIPSQYTIRTICGTSPQYQLRGRFVFLEHINLTQT
jgi:protein involved in polysaccharide export with SLBB domain